MIVELLGSTFFKEPPMVQDKVDMKNKIQSIHRIRNGTGNPTYTR